MHDDTKGLLYGCLGVILFGLTLPATRLAVAEIHPVMIGIGRTVIAAAAAGAILMAIRAPWPGRHHLRALVVTALGVVIGFPLFSAVAMQWAPASHGGVVLGILPLTTAIASVVLARERPSAGFWLCGLIGSAAVVAYALIDGGTELHIADTLLVLAVISASVGYAAGGELSRSLGGGRVICWALVIALPVTLPVVAVLLPQMNWAASAPAWGGFVYVALLSQLLGFFAWNRGMVLSGIARIGQLQLVQPFVTLAASAVVLAEVITPVTLGFAAFVVAVVALGRRMRVERRGLAGQGKSA